MNWKITVKPATATLSEWVWTAERGDGETMRSGTKTTQQAALEEARDMVRYVEAEFKAISDNTIEEDYTPSEVEILAAR